MIYNKDMSQLSYEQQLAFAIQMSQQEVKNTKVDNDLELAIQLSQQPLVEEEKSLIHKSKEVKEEERKRKIQESYNLSLCKKQKPTVPIKKTTSQITVLSEQRKQEQREKQLLAALRRQENAQERTVEEKL